jgi:hypothetical protein
MNKITLLLSIILIKFSCLFAAEDSGLSVVIGCDGKSGQVQHYYQTIMGEADCCPHHHMLHVDLRPRDSAKCPPENYMQADAKSWKPEAPLRHVYMELFPSKYVSNQEDLRRMLYQVDPGQLEIAFAQTAASITSKYPAMKAQLGNLAPSLERILEDTREFMSQKPVIDQTLMPDTIKNLAQYMRENGLLEIEHIPYTDIRPLKISPSVATYLSERNPFHLNVSPVFIELLQSSLNPVKGSTIWEETRCKLREKEIQIDGLIAEAVANESFCEAAITNIRGLLGEKGFTAEFFTAQLEEDIRMLSVDFNEQYFTNSLASVIAVEMYMLQNQADPSSGIQKFLRDNGFTDVTMNRIAVNTFNGRQNPWIISAKREARSINTRLSDSLTSEPMHKKL